VPSCNQVWAANHIPEIYQLKWMGYSQQAQPRKRMSTRRAEKRKTNALRHACGTSRDQLHNKTAYTGGDVISVVSERIANSITRFFCQPDFPSGIGSPNCWGRRNPALYGTVDSDRASGTEDDARTEPVESQRLLILCLAKIPFEAGAGTFIGVVEFVTVKAPKSHKDQQGPGGF
jgi:hypothetical protein